MAVVTEGQLAPSVEGGTPLCDAPSDCAETGVNTSLASAKSVTLNLITGGFGIGIFSLPWSMAGASLIPGLLTIIAVVAVNVGTISILIEGADKYQAFDLGSLLSNLPKRISLFAQTLTNISVWAVLFVTQVGYTNVMADAVMSMTAGTNIFDRKLATVLVSIVVLPICFLNQKYLNFTSTFAVLVNLYIFLVMASSPKNTDGACLLGAGTGTISMISCMMQAIVIQMCVLPMYAELEGRSPRKFGRVVRHSFSTLALIFCAFAGVGYLTYGPNVKGNILDSLPKNAWGKAATVGAGLCMGGVYPIFQQAMVAPVWNMEGLRFRRVWYAMAIVITITLTTLAALRFRDIAALNVMTGAFCAVIFVAFIPSLIGLTMLGRTSRKWRAVMLILLSVGSVAGILGLVFKDNYSGELDNQCMWSL